MMTTQDKVLLNALQGKPEHPKAEAVGTLLGSVLGSASMLLLGGWGLMLLVGVLASTLFLTLPTLGFWTAVALVFLLRLVFGGVRGPSGWAQQQIKK